MKPADHRLIFQETWHRFFEPLAMVAFAVTLPFTWRRRIAEERRGLRGVPGYAIAFLKVDKRNRSYGVELELAESLRSVVGPVLEDVQVRGNDRVGLIKASRAWGSFQFFVSYFPTEVVSAVRSLLAIGEDKPEKRAELTEIVDALLEDLRPQLQAVLDQRKTEEMQMRELYPISRLVIMPMLKGVRRALGWYKDRPKGRELR